MFFTSIFNIYCHFLLNTHHYFPSSSPFIPMIKINAAAFIASTMVIQNEGSSDSDEPLIICDPLQFNIVAKNVASIQATDASLVTAHFIGNVTSMPGTINHEFTLNTGAWNAKVLTFQSNDISLSLNSNSFHF